LARYDQTVNASRPESGPSGHSQAWRSAGAHRV